MYSKNNKKLNAINAKIDDLLKIKSQLENDFIQDLSQQIAKILMKKNVYNIDKIALLKKIEATIDEVSNQK